MTLKDDIIADAAIYFDTDEFGSAATYRAKGTSTDVNCTVVLDQIRDEDVPKAREGLDYFAQQGRLWCQVSEVAAPRSGDTFTVGGVDWIVQEVMAGTPMVWQLVVYARAYAGGVGK